MKSGHFLHKILIVTAVIMLVFTVLISASGRTVPASVSESAPTYTVILDAGHGGEDGGASSADGILEKGLNLSVVLLLADLLRADGIEVILTRSEDIMLYDRDADYQSHKKRLDMQARLKIAEENPNGIFVSIHMNSFPSVPSCKGVQVWYSPNNPDSQMLASAIQISARAFQPGNKRAIKQAGSNIYLLNNVTIPAVLCECGFLSNPEEARLLNTPEYRQKIAEALKIGIETYLQSDAGSCEDCAAS